MSQCTYQDKCHHITRDASGKVCNNEKTGVICFFLHEGEDMKNYRNRVIEKKRALRKVEREAELKELKDKELKEKELKELKEKELKELKEKELKEKIEVEKKRKNDAESIILKKQKIDSNESGENNKIVIRIPKNMAVEMMELMLASGKKNIEFQFTD